jgi:hypothetical protein
MVEKPTLLAFVVTRAVSAHQATPNPVHRVAAAAGFKLGYLVG